MTSDEEMDKRIKAQADEFSAVCDLCIAYKGLPAVVDDDYPEMRHYYDRAMDNLIKALRANGRIP